MEEKIFDYSISETLNNIYDGECLNIYEGANILLTILYLVFGSIVSRSKGINFEDNIKIINTLIGACTLIPSAILLKELKSVLTNKQVLSEKRNEINELRKKLGLGKIKYVRRDYKQDGEYIVTIEDRKGKIIYLKEVRNILNNNIETFSFEEVNKRTLK